MAKITQVSDQLGSKTIFVLVTTIVAEFIGICLKTTVFWKQKSFRTE